MAVKRYCVMTPEAWALLEPTPDEEEAYAKYQEKLSPKPLTEEEIRKAKNKAKRDKKKRR